MAPSRLPGSAGFLFLTLSVVSSVEVAKPKLVADVVHEGCYYTNTVDAQPSYYKIKQSLTWEKGIAVCRNRYTTHMGVRAENGSSTTNYFFCGNDLHTQSIVLNDSDCALCGNRTDRFCGGLQAISLYKIRDSTPLVIFLATINGAWLNEFEGYDRPKQINTLRTNSKYSQVDFLYSEDEILVRSGDRFKMFNSSFDNNISKYKTPKQLNFNFEFGRSCSTVDWVNKLIYFYGKTYITEYDMASNNVTIYLTPTASSNVVNLEIDPYNRTLFFIYANGSLSSLSLANNKTKTYMGGQHKIQNAVRVAVDCHNQLIYVIATLTADNTFSLVTLNYADTDLTELYQGPELSNPQALDVFNGSVVWVNKNNKIYTMYDYKVSPDCDERKLKTLQISSLAVYDLAIYNPLKQTPTSCFNCQSAFLGCSDICQQVTMIATNCSSKQEKTEAATSMTSANTTVTTGGSSQAVNTTMATSPVSITSIANGGISNNTINGLNQSSSVVESITSKTTEITTTEGKDTTMTLLPTQAAAASVAANVTKTTCMSKMWMFLLTSLICLLSMF